MKILLYLFLLFAMAPVVAQPVTGVWRGKITNGSGMMAKSATVELKLIKKGDSLLGTCYYYKNTNSYVRYAVKGYFDSVDNSVHWWDDKFLGVKPVGKTKVFVYTDPMVSQADFNCPGGNVMKLDGASQIGKDGPEFTLHFDKIVKPIFKDEWDNVIEGYFTGMADPDIIDSVFAITKPYDPGYNEDVAASKKPVIPGQNTVAPNAGVTNSSGENNKAPIITGTVAASNTTMQPVTDSKNNSPTQANSNTGGALKTDPAPVGLKETVAVTALPVNGKVTDSGKATVKTTAAPNSSPVTKTTVVTAGTTAKVADESKKDMTVKPTATNSTGAPNAGVTPGKSPVVVVATGKAVTNSDVAKQNTPVPPKPSPAPTSNTNQEPPVTVNTPVTGSNTVIASAKTTEVMKPIPTAAIKVDPLAEKMFVTRKKINQAEIPVTGDSVELNFYDNAEIDGDSISLFLNGKLLFNHVLLSAQAYTFKIATSDLPEGSELTMVAENLGTIPPNTAYMMAVVNGQRYSARLESTEQSSGVIRLMRRR